MTALLSVLVVTVVAGLIGNWLWERRIRDHVRVLQIKDQAAEELPALLELYGTLFPDESANYSGEYIMSLLPDETGKLRKKHVPCTDVMLCAKVARAVVGFVFCHYYPDPRVAVVSYYGVDRASDAARIRDAAGALVKKLRDVLAAQTPPCNTVVFELQHRPLRAVFYSRAKQLGLSAVELPIEYRRPRLNLETELEGDRLSLIAVRLAPTGKSLFTTDDIVRILETMFLSGYGDYYIPSDPRHDEYQAYLRSRLDAYRKQLA